MWLIERFKVKRPYFCSQIIFILLYNIMKSMLIHYSYAYAAIANNLFLARKRLVRTVKTTLLHCQNFSSYWDWDSS